MHRFPFARKLGNLLLLSLACIPFGCGSDERKIDESDKIDSVVRSTTEFLVMGNQAIFVDGAIPEKEEDRKPYLAVGFRPLSPPQIKGDTATVKVQLVGADGEAKGEVEWTLVRQEGYWKIKSAPLP